MIGRETGRRRETFAAPAGLAPLLLLVGACTHQPPEGALPLPPGSSAHEIRQELADSRKQMDRLQREKRQLEKRLFRTQEQNRALKLELLDATARIYQLEAQKEQAIEEVVRTKARLRSRQSRAEAVANLAEVKLGLQQAAERKNGPESRQLLDQARQLTEMAEQALDENNLEGASYLVAQARALLAASREQGPTATGNRQGETLFPVPFEMEVKRKGNVRLEPGLKSEVLFQLGSGDRVLVLGRRDGWLHVRTRDKRTGWMHFNLLENPD